MSSGSNRSVRRHHPRLIQRLQELRERLEDFDPRDLQGNEAFVTTVLATSILAIKTHQAEKLESFRHAIVNSVLPGAPDEFEQMTFLRYIDELTPLHVRVLTLLDDPRGWFDRHGIPQPNFMSAGIGAVLDPGVPELGGRKDQVLTDLGARGLTVGTNPGVASADSIWSQHTTPLGRAFLAFITAPPQESAAERV